MSTFNWNFAPSLISMFFCVFWLSSNPLLSNQADCTWSIPQWVDRKSILNAHSAEQLLQVPGGVDGRLTQFDLRECNKIVICQSSLWSPVYQAKQLTCSFTSSVIFTSKKLFFDMNRQHCGQAFFRLGRTHWFEHLHPQLSALRHRNESRLELYAFTQHRCWRHRLT